MIDVGRDTRELPDLHPETGSPTKERRNSNHKPKHSLRNPDDAYLDHVSVALVGSSRGLGLGGGSGFLGGGHCVDCCLDTVERLLF